MLECRPQNGGSEIRYVGPRTEMFVFGAVQISARISTDASRPVTRLAIAIFVAYVWRGRAGTNLTAEVRGAYVRRP